MAARTRHPRQQDEKKRLSEALRANLRRRKQANKAETRQEIGKNNSENGTEINIAAIEPFMLVSATDESSDKGS